VALEPLVYLLLALVPLIFVQRRLHAEIQLIFLLLTRRIDLAIALFSILFFPGVLLHEGSHYLMAKLLGVRTGRVSLLPRSLPGGRLQMGYVETEIVDPLRETLIGAAPLIAGGLFVAFAGLYRLGLLNLWNAYAARGLDAALEAIPSLAGGADFWLWLFLTFVVSSTMLPSASDRRAWLPLALVVGGLFVIGLLAGGYAAGGMAAVTPWLAANLAPPLERLLRALALVFGISLGLHILLVIPLYLLRRLLSYVLRLEVVA
jgi:hypothetical protein